VGVQELRPPIFWWSLEPEAGAVVSSRRLTPDSLVSRCSHDERGRSWRRRVRLAFCPIGRAIPPLGWCDPTAHRSTSRWAHELLLHRPPASPTLPNQSERPETHIETGRG
jgi:hypothetical protein